MDFKRKKELRKVKMNRRIRMIFLEAYLKMMIMMIVLIRKKQVSQKCRIALIQISEEMKKMMKLRMIKIQKLFMKRMIKNRMKTIL